jgi:hypothetical protein
MQVRDLREVLPDPFLLLLNFSFPHLPDDATSSTLDTSCVASGVFWIEHEIPTLARSIWLRGDYKSPLPCSAHSCLYCAVSYLRRDRAGEGDQVRLLNGAPWVAKAPLEMKSPTLVIDYVCVVDLLALRLHVLHLHFFFRSRVFLISTLDYPSFFSLCSEWPVGL